jgi:hypothetical protein
MKLRLGPLPKTEVVKLSITIPVVVKEQLDRYAELHKATYGQEGEIGIFIAQILEQFMARDRAFQKALRVRGSKPTVPLRSDT